MAALPPQLTVGGIGRFHTHFLISLADWLPTTEIALRANVQAATEAGRQHCLLLDSGLTRLALDQAKLYRQTAGDILAQSPYDIDGFDELLRRYIIIAGKMEPELWGYIEPAQGPTSVKRQLRRMLFEDHGLRPIPTFHPLTDPADYFDELAADYDRVVVCNLTESDAGVRQSIIAWIAERLRYRPNLWVHLHGCDVVKWLPGYPSIASADSSLWGYSPLDSSLAKSDLALGAYAGPLPSDMDVDRSGALLLQIAGRCQVAQQSWRKHLSYAAADGLTKQAPMTDNPAIGEEPPRHVTTNYAIRQSTP